MKEEVFSATIHLDDGEGQSSCGAPGATVSLYDFIEITGDYCAGCDALLRKKEREAKVQSVMAHEGSLR